MSLHDPAWQQQEKPNGDHQDLADAMTDRRYQPGDRVRINATHYHPNETGTVLRFSDYSDQYTVMVYTDRERVTYLFRPDELTPEEYDDDRTA